MQRLTLLVCAWALTLPLFAGSSSGVEWQSGDHWPDRVIVKFNPMVQLLHGDGELVVLGDPELSQVLQRQALKKATILWQGSDSEGVTVPEEFFNLYLLEFEPGSDYLRTLELLQQSPAVLYAELDLRVYPRETPNDQSFEAEQWGLQKIMAPSAWDVAHGISSVTIAILDSGMDLAHPDLQSNFWINTDEMANGIDDDGNGYVDDTIGWDFLEHDGAPDDDVRCNHGTHVGGTASAVTDNGIGVAGVAWNCRLMNLRIMGWNAGMQTCVGSVSDSILGIQYAVANGADVINMSIGHGGQAASERDAVNWAFSEGLMLVGAAGNGGNDGIGDPVADYPGGYEVVICVGNSNKNDRKDSSSNYGPSVDVFAPGSRIYSTYMPSTYSNASGTSMASPHVAGLVALIKASGVTDNNQIRMRIEAGAENIDAVNPAFVGMLGHGRINAWYSIIPTSLVSPIGLAITDHGGDNDGQADSGETIDLVFTFKNHSWRAATGGTVRLTDAGPNATILEAEAAIPDLASKAEGINPSPLTLSIAASAPFNTTVSVTMLITTADWAHTETYEFSLNDPRPPMIGWPKLGASNYFNSSPVFVDLNQDGTQELILCDNAAQVFIWQSDGTDYPGWPITLPDALNHICISTPAVGDLDRDGILEIVVASFRIANSTADPPYPAQGKLFVFTPNGELKTGWPLTLEEEIKTSPALADLDHDGDLEIVFGGYDNNVYVYHHTGVAFPNWPVNVGTDVFSSPAIADLDGNGTVEIVIGLKDDADPPEYGRILVFDPNGTILPGFPLETPGQVYPSAALADLDHDQDLEIIIGCGNYAGGEPERSLLYAIHHTGVPVTGWPIAMPDTMYGSPAIGDLDGDRQLDVVIGCFDGKIYAFNSSGQPVPGWPVTTGDQIYSSPAIADLEGDGIAEVFIGSYDSNLYGFKADGTILAGYPIPVGGEIFVSPAIADIDGDGDLEIAVADSVGNVYIWNDAHQAERNLEWGKFRNTLENTGVYSSARNTPPAVMVLGYWTSTLTAANGGSLQLLAAVIDSDGAEDLAEVELYFGGLPTGVLLHDDGASGDFSAYDGVYGIQLELGPGVLLPGSILLEVLATDLSGTTSWLAPYLEVQ